MIWMTNLNMRADVLSIFEPTSMCPLFSTEDLSSTAKLAPIC